jgi:hypothetical protein
MNSGRGAPEVLPQRRDKTLLDSHKIVAILAS